MRVSLQALGLIGCFVLILSINQSTFSQSIVNPSLSDLKALSYTPASQPSLSGVPSYQDILNTIQSAEGYAHGRKILPTYKEPITTRGVSGIAVFRAVSPSVVLVVVGKMKAGDFDPEGLGAGVVVDSSGDVLTNWHVINGYGGAVVFLKPLGSSEVDKDRAYIARVVAQDETADLALLKLLKPPADLKQVTLGNIASVQVAEDIHIIGHPKGELWSYSTGVISQVRNPYDWTYEDGSKHESKVLQLQTAINPGNSGGPVLDDQGTLLGLVAMSEEGQNLDYAIAVDVIRSFLGRSASLVTRGSSSEPKSPPAEYSKGQLQDGRAVLKASYPDLTVYVISEAAGKPLVLVAESIDGTHLVAHVPNSFGGFDEWTISLANGSVIQARGKGSLPDRFSPGS